MREPTIKSVYKDRIRNITFEVLYYVPMEKKQIRQVLDEYYRRYDVSFPEEGSTVRVVCDSCGPLPPE